MSEKPRRMHTLARTQVIARPLGEVFEFFSDAGNLEALTPAFLRFRFLTPLPIAMKVGARIDYALSLFGVPIRWRTRIEDWQPDVQFVDVQESGPYSHWRHTHSFEAAGNSTIVRDRVDYVVPFGALGSVAHFLFVGRMLDRIFDFRRDKIAAVLGVSVEAASPLSSSPATSTN
jgi:ligand-binding SRPBCC domain-containing protein